MDDNRDLVEAIKNLEKKMDDFKHDLSQMKEEILLSRDDIQYVKKLKQIATVDDIARLGADVYDLKRFKHSIRAVAVTAQFVYGFVLWYITK